jgi:hypothetical protein
MSQETDSSPPPPQAFRRAFLAANEEHRDHQTALEAVGPAE